MKYVLKKCISILIVAAILCNIVNVQGKKKETDADISLQSQAAVLMEASSGKIIYEKNSHEKLRPASITKVMTMILIFEAIEKGKLKLTDKVTVSEYAASMGGSQVFLEPGEIQTVEDMIKCISIASANDASVAMAEYIAGSEQAFVKKMNQKAKELGMNDTNFVNSCGLDVDGHITSAYDIALMSRELSVKYPDVHKYCTTWQDTITHVTKKGSKEFTLTNTNKIIRQYSGATGLKTGSTGLAKYCLSATAVKNDMELIAVIMAAPDYKIRFKEAAQLLDYGFANISLYTDDTSKKEIGKIPVKKSIEKSIEGESNYKFSYLLTKGENPKNITKKIVYNENITAPIRKGDYIGKITYYIGKKEIGFVNIISRKNVKKAKFSDYFTEVTRNFLKITYK